MKKYFFDRNFFAKIFVNNQGHHGSQHCNMKHQNYCILYKPRRYFVAADRRGRRGSRRRPCATLCVCWSFLVGGCYNNWTTPLYNVWEICWNMLSQSIFAKQWKIKIFSRRLLSRDLEKCSLFDVISRFQKQMSSTLALLQSIFNLYFRSLRVNLPNQLGCLDGASPVFVG